MHLLKDLHQNILLVIKIGAKQFFLADGGGELRLITGTYISLVILPLYSPMARVPKV